MPVPPRPSASPTITVVGIGADGWSGLAAGVREQILSARTLLGGARHLDLVPSAAGRRVPWPSPLRDGLAELMDSLDVDDAPVVALASGDPLVSGIGSTLLEVLGPDRVRIVPAVSSVAIARAEMGWPAESCTVVSVVGRPATLVLRELAPRRRVLVLSSDEHTPGEIAGLLTTAGYGESMIHVLGDLGTDTATHLTAKASDWGSAPSISAPPRLNIVALDLAGPARTGWVAGLPDDAFEHDGQLTKRDLRASALARLAPAPGQVLWDVGAGAGSVGIEWMRAHPSCTSIAVESNDVRAERITRNAGRLGVPGLRVVTGRAPDALAGLPAPDAVFIGGGATVPGVVAACLRALRPGGRLVIHGVTLDTERVLADLYTAHGGELTRIAVETAAPIGSFTGWTPARTVTQWAYTLPAAGR